MWALYQLCRLAASFLSFWHDPVSLQLSAPWGGSLPSLPSPAWGEPLYLVKVFWWQRTSSSLACSEPEVLAVLCAVKTQGPEGWGGFFLSFPALAPSLQPCFLVLDEVLHLTVPGLRAATGPFLLSSVCSFLEFGSLRFLCVLSSLVDLKRDVSCCLCGSNSPL